MAYVNSILVFLLCNHDEGFQPVDNGLKLLQLSSIGELPVCYRLSWFCIRLTKIVIRSIYQKDSYLETWSLCVP